MCVIVFIPEGITLDESVLKKCFDKNAHGWGLMYAKDGVIQTAKDVTDFEAFLQMYRTMPVDKHRCVHFRIKTSGEINKDNCHPFMINLPGGPYTMMHNGVLSIPEFNPDFSDTWHFARYLEGMYKRTNDLLFDPEIMKQIPNGLGYSNKIIFMNPHGDTMRYGSWDKKYDCWFSNLTFDLPAYTETRWPSGVNYAHSHWDAALGIWVPDDPNSRWEYKKKKRNRHRRRHRHR